MQKRLLGVVMLLLSVTTIVSCGMIVRELMQREKDKAGFDELSQLINDTSASEADALSEQETDVLSYGTDAGVDEENPLFEKNGDCIGWICIPGTTVDYPVMYTPEEPQKYLHKNFDGEYSAAGIPFLQEVCTLNSDHLVVYGHNMKNGTMFADVKKYLDADYLAKHSVIEFETAEGLKCYQIFAVVQLKKNDGLYSFVSAETNEQYDDFISDIKERSLYDSEITPTYGQQIITLSTCYGSSKDDRLIVIGVAE